MRFMRFPSLCDLRPLRLCCAALAAVPGSKTGCPTVTSPTSSNWVNPECATANLR